MFRRKATPTVESYRPLTDYAYEELARLKLEVESELELRGDSELEALKKKLFLIADAQGVSVEDLLTPPKKERKKRDLPPKYVNPDNPEETWSGAGKPKKWLQEKLDSGARLEDFALDCSHPLSA